MRKNQALIILALALLLVFSSTLSGFSSVSISCGSAKDSLSYATDTFSETNLEFLPLSVIDGMRVYTIVTPPITVEETAKKLGSTKSLSIETEKISEEKESKDYVEKIDTSYIEELSPSPMVKASITASEAYSCPDNSYIGRLTAPSIGIDMAIKYSLNQDAVDAPGQGAAYDCFTLPGDPTGSAVIGDHNFQQGKFFQYAVPGTRFYFDSIYGYFVFEMDQAFFGTITNEVYNLSSSFLARRQRVDNYTCIGDDIRLEDSSFFYDGLEVDGQNNLYLITCYPFNATRTDERYIVRCHFVEGTTFLD